MIKQWDIRRKILKIAGAISLIGLATASHACELTITWQADLGPSLAASQAVAVPAGKAVIGFDFAHPGATVKVDTRNLQDVRQIEMHVARSFTDHSGPTVLTLYSLGDGPLPAALTKHVSEADLHKQTTPKIDSLADLVTAVVSGRAYITVATAAHPEGALSGIIRMHKEEIYSDRAGDTAHDPALHHTALLSSVNPPNLLHRNRERHCQPLIPPLELRPQAIAARQG